jgi:hypothetical protein
MQHVRIGAPTHNEAGTQSRNGQIDVSRHELFSNSDLTRYTHGNTRRTAERISVLNNIKSMGFNAEFVYIQHRKTLKYNGSVFPEANL